MTFDDFLRLPPYSLSSEAKEAELVSGINELASHHYARSPAYRRIADACWGGVVTADRSPTRPTSR